MFKEPDQEPSKFMKFRDRIQPVGQFRNSRAYGTLLAFGILSAANASAQVTVYNRSDSGTGLWWSDSPNPWWYGYTANRPDNGGRNNVIYDHDNNLTSTVNGTYFSLRTLTLAGEASSSRIFNTSAGGGISLSVGFINNSAGSHQFNVSIRVDGTTVAFVNNGGAVSFASNIYLNTNTAEFSGAGNVTLSGPVSGSGGSISKSGAGTLKLTNSTNSYTGATAVNQGMLTLSTTGSIATSATVNVGTGATLDVSAQAGGWKVGGGANTQKLTGSGNVTGATIMAGTSNNGTHNAGGCHSGQTKLLQQPGLQHGIDLRVEPGDISLRNRTRH